MPFLLPLEPRDPQDLAPRTDDLAADFDTVLADSKVELARAEQHLETLNRTGPWGLVGAGLAALFFCLAGLLAALGRRRGVASTNTHHGFLEASTLRRGALRAGLLALLLAPLTLIPLALGLPFQPIGLLGVSFLALAAGPLILVEVWGARKESLGRHSVAALAATGLAAACAFLGQLQVMFTTSRLNSGSSQAWGETLKAFQEAPAVGIVVTVILFLACGAVWGLGVFQRLRATNDAGWAGTLVRLPASALLIGVGLVAALLGVMGHQAGMAWASSEAVMNVALREAGVVSGVVLVGLILHGVAAWGADRLEGRWFPPPSPLPHELEGSL